MNTEKKGSRETGQDEGVFEPRRDALKYLLRGSLITVLLPAAWVTTEYLTPPRAVPAIARIPADTIPAGGHTIVKIGLKDALVRHEQEGEYSAFSLRCTHAGCAVDWREAQEEFFCQCHGGVFNRSGEAIQGPPKEPLERLPIRLQEGTLIIGDAATTASV